MFPGILDFSITGEALKKALWSYEAINIRDYAFDARKTVDDTPYGGSAGMIFKADIVANAIEKNLSPKTKKIIYLSPRGKVFNQQLARQLAQEDEIMMLCARYEGVDQRVIDEFAIEEISLGDFVLSGGELAAAVVVDAIARLIPGVLNDETSALTDSFQDNLLSPPVYTRPPEFRGWKVPEVLLSGDPSKVEAWREEQAYIRTKTRRPDLLID
jgi:tRNA (guanine37-N1)-methyltransferase